MYAKDVIYYAVNARFSPFEDFIAPFLTDIGNGWTTIILALIMLLFNYRKAFLLATGYAITSLFAQVLKFIFDAPRPKLYFKANLTKIHFVKGVDMLMYHSFPSGHTVTAFSTALLVTYFCKNKMWGIPLLILAALVGYSRMYLSEHFFEDVMAGSAVGVFITIFWISYIDRKAFLHKSAWNKGLLFNKIK